MALEESHLSKEGTLYKKTRFDKPVYNSVEENEVDTLNDSMCISLALTLTGIPYFNNHNANHDWKYYISLGDVWSIWLLKHFPMSKLYIRANFVRNKRYRRKKNQIYDIISVSVIKK